MKHKPVHLALIALTGIALVATVLRLLHLGRQSLWVDECDTMTIVQQPWPAFWETLWRVEANMVAYYLLLRGWIHLGTTEFIVRAFSVIPAVATIFVVYLFGKRLFSTRVGLVSALLLAVNACHVAYSQEARSYSLLILLCTLSMFLFVIAVEHSTTRNWLLYALLTAAAVYTHFFAGLLIAAEWASLAFLPHRAVDWKRFSLAAFLIAVSTAPALWFILHKDVGQFVLIPNPGLLDLYHLLLFLTSYGGKAFGALLAVVYLASLGASLWIFSAAWRQSGRSMESWRIVFLLSCLMTPILLDMSISHLGKQIFFYRYLLICLPALIVLVARGLCSLPSQRSVAFALFVVCLLSMVTVWRYYAKPKENWRSATQDLLSRSKPEDTIVFYPYWAQQPLRYYQERLHLPANMPHLVPAQFYSVRTPDSHRSEVVWLVSCREDEFLQSFRRSLAQVYPHHHELRYNGAVVEEYRNRDQQADGIQR